MEDQSALYQIVDGSLPENLFRVAGIALNRSPVPPHGKGALLKITSSGEYRLHITLQMDDGLLCTLENNMRRPFHQIPPGPQAYAEELFNLLCGRIISQINRKYHFSAKFNVPQYTEAELPIRPVSRLSACYSSPSGKLCLGIDSHEEKLDSLFC